MKQKPLNKRELEKFWRLNKRVRSGDYNLTDRDRTEWLELGQRRDQYGDAPPPALRRLLSFPRA